MIRAALIGLGKMGLSHHAIINAHPKFNLVAVCDVTDYVLATLNKYTGIKVYTDYGQLLAQEQLDAVFIASPSRFHGPMVRAALERGLHVFCEKPFCLDPEEGLSLATLAESKRLANQVGYHYRFVATFTEMKRLLSHGVIGKVHNAKVEAYGPVVIRPKGGTWRSRKSEGGGCLYDYACHGIDLLNYLVDAPQSVTGTILNKVFSQDVDDEVYSTFRYADGMTAQIAANWSDESFRKMSMKVSLWGSMGRMVADRQELQIWLREAAPAMGLREGWNTRYTTDLTEEVWYYLRGEEYSAQIDHFASCIENGATSRSPFRSAAQADAVAALMTADAAGAPAAVTEQKKGLFAALRRR